MPGEPTHGKNGFFNHVPYCLREGIARIGWPALGDFNNIADFQTELQGYLNNVLTPQLLPGDVVVMDNLQPHHAPGVRETIEAAGATLLHLLPYSPVRHLGTLVYLLIRVVSRSARPESSCVRHAEQPRLSHRM